MRLLAATKIALAIHEVAVSSTPLHGPRLVTQGLKSAALVAAAALQGTDLATDHRIFLALFQLRPDVAVVVAACFHVSPAKHIHVRADGRALVKVGERLGATPGNST